MRWATLLLLWPLAAGAADYLTIDDTTKSFLSEIVGCSGASNAVTYNATTKTFGCNSIGGGPGGSNTASNLGGGLANYDSASGTDLRFNTFWSTDFDLAANLLKIDDTKWATDAQVVTAIAGNDTPLQVWATADLAGVAGNLEGVDIAAAITACGTARCQVNLVAGTYTDVCMKITRDQGTYLIGRGIGVTILKPKTNPSTCATTDQGEMIQIEAADNLEIAYLEMDGDKESMTYPACGSNTNCGAAIVERNGGALFSNHAHIHDIYMHDFMGHGLAANSADHWDIDNSTFDNFGCVQDGTSRGCGCSLGAGCGGWDARPDIGYGTRVAAIAVSYGDTCRNSIARHNTIGWAPHGGLEVYNLFGPTCGTSASGCPDNIYFEDNDIANQVIVNSAQHVRIVRNRIHDPGFAASAGDIGLGIIVADSVFDVMIQGNVIYDNNGSGIVVKPQPPGGVTIDNNVLDNNCTDHDDGGNIVIWGRNVAGVITRDIVVTNNIAINSGGCTYALSSTAGGGALFEGRVQFLGGTYETGSTKTVKIDNANVEVRGLKVTGDLEFGATAHGFAIGNDVSGATTNTGVVCIQENDSTPIPDSCIGNLAAITVGAGSPPGTCTKYDYYGQTATSIRNCLCVATNTWQCSTAAAP